MSKEDDMEVAGQAQDGQSAVELAAQLQPDVIVIDVAIPNSNGIEAVRRIVSEQPDVIVIDVAIPNSNGIEAVRRIVSAQPGVKIVALSRHQDRWSVRRILDAGALGYVAKDRTFEELVLAIRTVVQNQTYVSPCISAAYGGNRHLNRVRPMTKQVL